MWNDKGKIEPPIDRLLIAYCPEWNEEGYQICKWDGAQFYYEGQPSDTFHILVEQWTTFLEAD